MGFLNKVKKAFGSKKEDVESQDSECSISRHDVFISYSTKDSKIANMICHVLEQNNLKCWIAPRDITSGRIYADEIADAIKSAKFVFLVFSKFSQESKYVNNEINLAVSYKKSIIAVNTDNTSIKEDMRFYSKINKWVNEQPNCEDEFSTLIQEALKLCKINKTGTFKYLDDLIHNGAKEISLDCDIVFGHGDGGAGIKLDVDDLVIDGKGHTIDAKNKTRIFYCTGKNITIKNITLKNGWGFYGGAIENNEGILTITKCILSGNSASDGGAIFNIGGELIITKSTLTKNTASYIGGAICNRGYLTIRESSLEKNTAKVNGGVIQNHKFFKCFDCVVKNNESPNNIVYNNDSLYVFNSNFEDNVSKNVLYNEGDLSNISLHNSEFRDNIMSGSNVFNDGKNCTVEKCIFENNTSDNIINKSDLILISPKIKDERKTILNEIEGHIVIKNECKKMLNQIYGDGEVECVHNEPPADKRFDFGYLDEKIHKNTSKEISLNEDICLETYERDYYEGGIELDIDDLVIDGNGHTIDAMDKTRIFIITGKNITFKNITFKNGHSHKNYDNPNNNHGGAIKVNHSSKLKIENCKFINNSSEEYGGAIHNLSKLIIKESLFTKNIAKENGGAIQNRGCLIITESTLDENTANGKNFLFDNGGGAIANSGELTIKKSMLKKNITSWGFGGAIFNRGYLNIIESILKENTAHEGGAIKNDSVLMIKKSLLTKNIGTGNGYNGGGAILNIGELNITESALTKNTAARGGAIKNESVMIITDSTLLNNRAGFGGAICLTDSKYESKECTFKDNKPDDVYEEKD